ncbi:MAG TPA: flavin oxidoreductase/NADH oxidase [Thermodesulfobacteriota bacterium]|nr:flavin oxidoreductase/NADH oxidase [Thermodesulfobacteriota bacterium]
MPEYGIFGFQTLEDLEAEVEARTLGIPFDRDLSVLGKPVSIGACKAPNALMIHPMEGRDADLEGSPGPLTFRRYERYGRGGAGLIWFEGTAIMPESRSSPSQLILIPKNEGPWKRLLDRTRKAASEHGSSHHPVCILQLQDVGRQRKIPGVPPAVLFQNPYWYFPADAPLMTDSDIESLEDRFVEGALLACRIGFEGIDIKSSNGYLGSDFLAAHNRKGRYGGTFEGRTRFLLNIVDKIRGRAPKDFLVTVRLNLYDGIPYPYGWGVSREDVKVPDLTEPVMLGRALQERGVKLINTSNGIPEYNPHLIRPYSIPVKGVVPPAEHPLETVSRIFRVVGDFQTSLPKVKVVGTAYSWLRQFAGYAAAAALKANRSSLIGMGRMAFAYPDFPKDLLEKGRLDPGRVCVTCSRCTQILRWGGSTGCALRDREIYGRIYQNLERENP